MKFVCEVYKEKALALKIWKLKGVTWVVKWMLEGNWKKNLKCWKGVVGHLQTLGPYVHVKHILPIS
jgi:hypothetical protein